LPHILIYLKVRNNYPPCFGNKSGGHWGINYYGLSGTLKIVTLKMTAVKIKAINTFDF